MRWLAAFSAFICLVFLVIAGCGGGGGGGGSTNVVIVSPSTASLAFNQVLSLTASVPGTADQTVTWTATGGTVNSTGASTAAYTAPATAGTYVITAHADANSSWTGTTTVTVTAIGIAISPIQATVAVNKTLNFTATVTGSANQNVIWSTTGGSIVSTGTNTAKFTAPAATGQVTVTAKAAADQNRKATSTLTITASVGNNAVVTGRVANANTNAGIAGIAVIFEDINGSVLAQYTTAANGTFSATVPTTARYFHLASSSITNAYYQSYNYNAKRYTALVSTCTAPLPALSAGVTTNLLTDITLPPTTDPPPPPPNGCH